MVTLNSIITETLTLIQTNITQPTNILTNITQRTLIEFAAFHLNHLISYIDYTLHSEVIHLVLCDFLFRNTQTLDFCVGM